MDNSDLSNQSQEPGGASVFDRPLPPIPVQEDLDLYSGEDTTPRTNRVTTIAFQDSASIGNEQTADLLAGQGASSRPESHLNHAEASEQAHFSDKKGSSSRSRDETISSRSIAEPAEPHTTNESTSSYSNISEDNNIIHPNSLQRTFHSFTNPPHYISPGSNHVGNTRLATPTRTVRAATTNFSGTPQRNTSAVMEYPRTMTALPRWQPDEDAASCPICGVVFGIFTRKHHCRKCGKVVCGNCSPHNITIPREYIVRAPLVITQSATHRQARSMDSSAQNFNQYGGGERVRLCNPCVPDPNFGPPTMGPSSPPPYSRPLQLSSSQEYGQGDSIHGRRSLRDSASSLPRADQFQQQHETNQQRARTSNVLSFNESTSWGDIGQHNATLPTGRSNMASAYSRTRAARGFSETGSRPSNTRLSSGPTPPRPMPSEPPRPRRLVAEADRCPICEEEYDRETQATESARAQHVIDCIARQTAGIQLNRDRTIQVPQTSAQQQPPAVLRAKMHKFLATDFDTNSEEECQICLDTYEPGQELARLKCFCKFHVICISGWWVDHHGKCPAHDHGI